MSVQNMAEPSAEQFRIASLLDEKKVDAEIESNIKKVIEFTGCDSDKAAVALYDTDNNVQMACLKIIEGDNSKTEQDSWKSVEKPPKKEPNREDKIDKFERSPQDNGRGRGRGQFRGGRGDYRGGRGRGKSYGQAGAYNNGDGGRDNYSFDRREGGRGRGGHRGQGTRGGRGGFRGRSEPPRQRYNDRQNFRPREEPNVKNSAASDSGSDWGEPNNKNDQNEWDKSEKWDITKEFKKSGWDEPDSMSKDSWNQKSPKQNQSRGKVDSWQTSEIVESSGWNEPESDSWGPEVNNRNNQKEGWNETREWDEAEAIAKPTQHDSWSNEEEVTPQRNSNKDTNRLNSIFNKNVNIADDAPIKSMPSSTVKPQTLNEDGAQVNQLPPGFAKNNSEQVLSFGRSPEIAGRRAPPPIRSSIPKQAVEMPQSIETTPLSQFCFGTFTGTDETGNQSQRQPEVRSQPPADSKKPTETAQEYSKGEKTQRFQPQAPHRPNTATSNSSDQNTDIEHGLISAPYLMSREKAEKDLRKLLNRPPSGSSSSNPPKPTNPHSSNSGVVPGLPIQSGLAQRQPQSPPGKASNDIMAQTGGSSGASQPSAPGQGRMTTPQARQPSYQPSPTISTADPMGLHSYGNSSMPAYDMLLNRQVSRPDDVTLRQPTQPTQPLSTPGSYQPYHPMQPYAAYGLTGMAGYFPVIGQNSSRNAYQQQMQSAYGGSGVGMGQGSNSDSLSSQGRRIHSNPQDLATPPPFNLSPHTYQQPPNHGGHLQEYAQYNTHPGATPVAFQQLLIPPNQQHMMNHHQQDNRGPRQNL